MSMYSEAVANDTNDWTMPIVFKCGDYIHIEAEVHINTLSTPTTTHHFVTDPKGPWSGSGKTPELAILNYLKVRTAIDGGSTEATT